MDYRPLGQTDIKVSAFALGVMTFGAQTDEKDAFAQLDIAFDAGVNFFDTAENYPAPVTSETQGRSEEILGQWVATRNLRDKVIIATKVTGPRDMAHIRGENRHLDRANITQAIEGSLRRLKTDYVDLYQLHWPERLITTAARPRFVNIPDAPETIPIEETLGVLADLVAAGKVRNIGVSNETPWGISRFIALSEQRSWPRIATVQNIYNLLNRGFEIAMAETALRDQVGLLAYSPLSSGLLTGKYLNANTAPDGSRLQIFPGFDKRYGKPKIQQAVEAYVEIAHKHDLDPAAMALAFVRQQPFVTSVLAAASNSGQLEKTLKSLEITLDRDLLKEINTVHDNNPNPAW